MKTTLFSFLLCISSLAFAQFDPVTDESFGTFTPLFQYQGNLFVRQNIDGSWMGLEPDYQLVTGSKMEL